MNQTPFFRFASVSLLLTISITFNPKYAVSEEAKSIKISKTLEAADNANKAMQAQKILQKLDATSSNTILQPVSNSATKSLAQLQMIQQVVAATAASKQAAKFRTIAAFSVKLENGTTYTTLHLGVMVELDTEVSGFMTLFSDYEATIQTALSNALKGLTDVQLTEEQENKTILKGLVGKVNSESKSPFIVDMNYTVFKLS